MKPKVAFYWCAACGGCEECVLDLAEDLLPVLDAVEITFWPVALDFKEKDVQPVDICFINGAIRTTEQEHMARLLRSNAQTVVAFGACAQMGGIPGLANLASAEEILREAYSAGAAPQEESRVNGYTLRLPRLFDSVQALDRIIPVDYYVPGCPPTPKVIKAALATLLGPDGPPKGAVLAPDRAVCDECPRRDTRPATLMIDQLRRVHECILDESLCILAQGVPCLGSATRAGCDARCVGGNMPCTGCFGPSSRVRDFGAKALSAIASILSPTEDAEIDRAVGQLADPAGTFYRYSLPVSLLQRKITEHSS
jgi:F420-non-reducing hydrogenase small subunit